MCPPPTTTWFSHPFEIGVFGDRQALQIAAQAVEAELDRTEPQPVAAAIDARAAGFRPFSRGDRKMDAAAEIDAVGAVFDLDQHGERVARAGLLPHRLRYPFSRLAAHFTRYQRAVETEGGGELCRIAGDETAAEHPLRTRQMGDAGGDLASGKSFDHCQ